MTAAAVELLTRSRARIAPPGAWERWGYARTADGLCALPTQPGVVAWCALGALWEERKPELTQAYLDADTYLCEAAHRLGSSTVAEYNMQHTQADVLGLYDVAIALAELATSGALIQ